MEKFIKATYIDLMSQDLCLSKVEFISSCYSKKLFTDYEVPFPIDIQNSTTLRQAEFFAGRLASNLCIRKLGIKVPSEIKMDKLGAPIWPNGYRGSISHTSAYAAALISRSPNIQFVGIDIEELMPDIQACRVSKYVANEIELSILSASLESYSERVTCAFSTKEAIFKALYPYIERHFGFDSARIVALESRNRVVLSLNSHLAKLHNLPEQYFVEFQSTGGCIFSKVLN
ncbi:4'-phosphopantetheinyl transferase superfamily protein [Vibrio sp. Of7-15]|uniref:4'-phosphopantetheinyl transferase family protein n=1 Tax=Vibrio sp. Of7-15 TaxID=2724879 RepID=UPI001EF38D76|nr:4'-phosphopantetheinyl transferase superfamily protein [Vibrio sp. Of7-15]